MLIICNYKLYCLFFENYACQQLGDMVQLQYPIKRDFFYNRKEKERLYE